MAKYRAGRINEEVKKEISDIIRTEIKDPRLTAMISVVDVNVTKDLRYAKVYISIFANSDEEKNAYLNARQESFSMNQDKVKLARKQYRNQGDDIEDILQ